MITISLVLYNNDVKDVKRYLDKLVDYVNDCEVIIVDNSNNTLPIDLNKYVFVKYIKSSKNLGYGSGHNLALNNASSSSKYFLISNLDVEFAFCDILVSLKYLKGDVVAISPKFIGKGKNYPRFFPFPGSILLRLMGKFFKIYLFSELVEKNKLYDDEFRYIPIASGAFILVKSDVFKEVCGFDKKMWMYIEDWDISRKFWEIGCILYLPTLIVKHEYNSSGLKSLILSISFLKNLFSFKLRYQFPFDFKRHKIHVKCKTELPILK
jgi:GT2 family glycosyltransferase